MNLETNTVPWSEMTTCGIPCLAYTSSRRILAPPSNDSSVEHAIGMISLEKRSMIIKIASYSWHFGRPVTILTEMWVHGQEGMALGWSGAAFA